MNNSIVSTISETSPSPTLRIHNSLEFFLRDVGSWVDYTTVTDDNRRGFTHLGQTSEVVLSVHLKFYEQTLKFYPLLHTELRHEDHTTRLDYQCWNLRHWKDSKAFLGHFFLNALQWCTFSTTRTTSDDNFKDRVACKLSRVFWKGILL